MPSRERKVEYFIRMKKLMSDHTKCLILGANHVGSFQFQQIRIALRDVGTVLMGKNTLMRKIVTEFIEENPGHPYEQLLPLLRGNVCLIFSNKDLAEVRQVVEENRVPAAAKAGVIAECTVVVPPGPTGCDPGQTAWFQALNVPTKISRGQIEIVSELKLVLKGDKVGSSEAALLQKLDIKPFTYGLVLLTVYDNGDVFSAAVLDITEEDLKSKFSTSCRRAAAIGLEIGLPTLCSLPHSVGNALRRALAISAETGYTFEGPIFEPWKAGFAAMQPAPAAEPEAAAE